MRYCGRWGVSAEHIPPTEEERAGLYRSMLAQISQPVLIIADNASSEARVRPLLPGVGPHKVMVTSRDTLARLGARLIDVTVLDEAASVELLDQALRAARPDDDRITRDHRAAVSLARACGGLPLALQITAALLNADTALSAKELADDLAVESERLERLRYDDGSETGAPSVAAAFELSYRRLDDTAARVFRLLPVNPGPDISTAAATALAGLPAAKARTVLGGLARAHLAETAPGVKGRWRMHDLVHMYAQRLGDEHAEVDGREQARDRLLGYYLDTADAADVHLRALPGMAVPERFTGREDALGWLDGERTSLVAAPAMAAATGRHQTALRLPRSLAEYLQWRRRFDDWRTVTAISLRAARRLGDRHGEGGALNNLGLALSQARRFDEAITACRDAVTIFRETGDRHGEGGALTNLGIALRQVRRFDEAITAYQQDLKICREIRDRYGEGVTLNNLSFCLRETGRVYEALTASDSAVAIFREVRHRHDEGLALNNLAAALYQTGNLDKALTTVQKAVAILREANDRHNEGTSYITLGAVLYSLGRSEESIAASEEAAVIFRKIAHPHGEAQALNNLGAALQGLGRQQEAIIRYRAAAAIYREMGDHHSEEIALYNIETARTAQQT
jgi:tetratricopeptide (TPR) repeat protein